MSTFREDPRAHHQQQPPPYGSGEGQMGRGPGQQQHYGRPQPPRYGNTGVGPGQRPPGQQQHHRGGRGGGAAGRPPHPHQTMRPPPPEYGDEPKPLVEAGGRPPRRAVVDGDDDDADSDGEYVEDSDYMNEPQEQPRQHKYSSANMERGTCCKYVLIVLMFVCFLAFSIGLSFLIKKVFFSEDENATGQPETYEMENATFQRDKAYVDTACGTGSFDQDGGMMCREVCEPQYSECCRAFLPENIYETNNRTAGGNNSSSTTAGGNNSSATETRSTDGTCSLATETKGCQSYAKCIAAIGKDPAPASLPNYCAEPWLTEDPETCNDICNVHRCCYAEGDRMHCRADRLDVCLDYAPCQNLRIGPKLETAPANLDQHCYQQTPECDHICKKAECCNVDHHPGNCLQSDFIACLTYAPCSYSPFTSTNITIAPQFNFMPKLPRELDAACNERHETALQDEEDPKSCKEICQVASCCYDEDPAKNCFKYDPLGCLAWDQQCQVNKLNGQGSS